MAGRIVILNGAPRSGKTSIARAIQRRLDGVWINLGVDIYRHAAPDWLQPAIGLRPGGERRDIERHLPLLFAGLYESIAAHSRVGLDVVVDIGHHDAHSERLHILQHSARRLVGLPVLLVGVRGPRSWSVGPIQRPDRRASTTGPAATAASRRRFSPGRRRCMIRGSTTWRSTPGPCRPTRAAARSATGSTDGTTRPRRYGGSPGWSELRAALVPDGRPALGRRSKHDQEQRGSSRRHKPLIWRRFD